MVPAVVLDRHARVRFGHEQVGPPGCEVPDREESRGNVVAREGGEYWERVAAGTVIERERDLVGPDPRALGGVHVCDGTQELEQRQRETGRRRPGCREAHNRRREPDRREPDRCRVTERTHGPVRESDPIPCARVRRDEPDREHGRARGVGQRRSVAEVVHAPVATRSQ